MHKFSIIISIFIAMNYWVKHFKFNNMGSKHNLMIFLFIAGSGYLEELPCQSLVIFHASMFYNDLETARDRLINN
jgi:hypothetical protein